MTDKGVSALWEDKMEIHKSQRKAPLVRTTPLGTTTNNTPTAGPNIFADPNSAYLSFRDALPGEGGDRNVFRLPGYFDIDSGLYKSFKIGERNVITLRWEVYNVTNTQTLTAPSGFGVSPIDPFMQGQFGLGCAPGVTTCRCA